MPTIRWASVRLTRIRARSRRTGPRRRPPAPATHRRRSTNMARAERNGLRVRATFKVAMGPNAQVTGASSTPKASSLVLAGN